MMRRNYLKLAFNKILRKSAFYKFIWKEAYDIYNLKTYGLQVVNTGSSSGVHAYYYSNKDIKGFNFAIAPQSLAHDFSIIKNYFSYFAEGCTVLITICPFSGISVTYDRKHNFKYYIILHPATITNFDEEQRTKAYQIVKDPLKSLHYNFVEFLWYQLSVVKDFFLIKTKKYYSHNADLLIKNWKNQFEIYDLSSEPRKEHKLSINTKAEILASMVDFCRCRGFRPVIVLPPVHKCLREKFPLNFTDNYINPLVAKAISMDCPFVNYFDSDKFNDDKLFDTSFLLSKKGAKKFSEDLFNQLKLC